MAPLRAAVIGVGYLGNFHAQKYAQHHDAELYAVVDTVEERAYEIAAKYGTRAVTDYRTILSEIDVVSIVVPPANHFEIAHDCLSAGVHTLVEKPVTERVSEAETLIEIASGDDLILQVGHLERFNPVVMALMARIEAPRLIETQRLASYKKRGTEVDVVLDLMIHDIDIVLSIARSAIHSIHATGTAVVTQDIDIAHARIAFEDGSFAELSASRVSKNPTRMMKVYEGQRYYELDYANHELHIGTVEDGKELEDASEFTFATESVSGTDVLMEEISSFLSSVRSGAAPQVTGEDGKKALEIAIDISRRINRYRATQPSVADSSMDD